MDIDWEPVVFLLAGIEGLFGGEMSWVVPIGLVGMIGIAVAHQVSLLQARAREVTQLKDQVTRMLEERQRELHELQTLSEELSIELSPEELALVAARCARNALRADRIQVKIPEAESLGSQSVTVGFGTHLHYPFTLEATAPADGGKTSLQAWRSGPAFCDSEARLLTSILALLGATLQHSALYREAVRQAEIDLLTGTYNHRTILARLEDCMAMGGNLSILLFDLDNFRLINEHHGYVRGDQVLKSIAGCLGATLPRGSYLGRYGADEFLAIVPGCGDAEAVTLANVCVERVRNLHVIQGHSDGDLALSLSIGVASHPRDADSKSALLSLCESNLAAARRSKGKVISITQDRNNRIKQDDFESFSLLDALVTSVDNKDSYTRQHSEDVVIYSLWIAEELGLSEASVRTIRTAALLHDVGKIGVPASILSKPGQLTDREREIMNSHPVLGSVLASSLGGIEEIIPGIRSHHERWDGQGYPDALAGYDIPFLGRLLAVADVFSALTTDRPYRRGIDPERATEIIREGIGTHFDPELAEAFLRAAQRRLHSATTLLAS